LKKEQTNPNLTQELPQQLKEEYRKSRKNSPAIEALKVAAALKLWNDRGFRDIKFDVPVAYGGKTMFIKVLAKHEEGTVFGVECASNVRLGYLKQRLSALQKCIPKDSYIVSVFPETASEKAEESVTLADEVWVTGKNGKINQMIFHSYLGKE
jgi:hypothetical protein